MDGLGLEKGATIFSESEGSHGAAGFDLFSAETKEIAPQKPGK
jgi:hypothetical protein